MKILLFCSLCLLGCVDPAPRPPADPQVIYQEAQIDAWCAHPELDQQSRDWCTARAAYQQRMAAAAQSDRDAAEDDRLRRQERAAAVRQALAPMQQPLTPITVPAPAPPRSCTSLVNGNLVTTTCN